MPGKASLAPQDCNTHMPMCGHFVTAYLFAGLYAVSSGGDRRLTYAIRIEGRAPCRFWMLAAGEACVCLATQINHFALMSINLLGWFNWTGLDGCSIAVARFVGLTASLAAGADQADRSASRPLGALARRGPPR